MRTCIAEATKACSTALPCCRITGKDIQRLELHVPVLVQCPVGESISGAGQPCAKDLPALSSVKAGSTFFLVQKVGMYGVLRLF